MRTPLWVVIALTGVVLLGACARLGYTDGVAVRAPSPDGWLVAVCQEVPRFDGPSFDIRLERPDGTRVRRLYQIGDGDPCDEIAWSADGRFLSVLSMHVARVMVVDVADALRDRGDRIRPTQVTLAMDGAAGRVRFAGNALEFDMCATTERGPASPVRHCVGTVEHRRLPLPARLLAAR